MQEDNISMQEDNISMQEDNISMQEDTNGVNFIPNLLLDTERLDYFALKLASAARLRKEKSCHIFLFL